jgi:HD superfamily phosphohydrolase
MVYPTANHTRGAHSIGVCFWSKKLVTTLNDNRLKVRPGSENVPDISRAEAVLISLGALVHDLPHGPFSHDIEKKTHYIYPLRTPDSRTRVTSYYGPYEKHDNFLANPALYVFLMDVENSVLARVLRKYSRQFAASLLNDARDHEHLAAFAEALNEWPRSDEELLPNLLFHLLVYEKYEEARRCSRPLVKTFGGGEKVAWGIGPEAAWKNLHESWYQPFRHDIIGDTLSADLLDYLMRDQSRLGMKNELDLKLLNYYVLVLLCYK